MFRHVAHVVSGVLLGVVLTEAGLRLYFYEHEANRNYWGPYAFVEDDVLPYRHAASAMAVAGREGSFGPHHITTNELGFRDRRIPTSGQGARPTPNAETPHEAIVVAGASFMFGLGVEQYDSLFHVQLERRIRERGDCPGDLKVFNIAQTGFKLNEICMFVEQELDRFRPRLVLLAVHSHQGIQSGIRRVDVVNGYRLERTRSFAGTWVDSLKTRSYLWMRGWPLHRVVPLVKLKRVVQYVCRRWQGTENGPSAGASSDDAAISNLLTGFRNRLKARGVDLVCVIIHFHDDPLSHLGDMLRQQAFSVIDLYPDLSWSVPRERHWNAFGHRKSAEFVARRIPLTCLQVHRSVGNP